MRIAAHQHDVQDAEVERRVRVLRHDRDLPRQLAARHGSSGWPSRVRGPPRASACRRESAAASSCRIRSVRAGRRSRRDRRRIDTSSSTAALRRSIGERDVIRLEHRRTTSSAQQSERRYAPAPVAQSQRASKERAVGDDGVVFAALAAGIDAEALRSRQQVSGQRAAEPAAVEQRCACGDDYAPRPGRHPFIERASSSTIPRAARRLASPRASHICSAHRRWSSNRMSPKITWVMPSPRSPPSAVPKNAHRRWPTLHRPTTWRRPRRSACAVEHFGPQSMGAAAQFPFVEHRDHRDDVIGLAGAVQGRAAVLAAAPGNRR